MSNLIQQMKREAENKRSRVAFRKLPDGSYVSVKYNDYQGWSSNDHTWTHATRSISESEAEKLISVLDQS